MIAQATTPSGGDAPLSASPWLARLAIEWAGRIFAVLLVLIVSWALAQWARRAVGRALDRPQIDKTLGRFLGNLTRWVILGLGVVGCLGFFGFNITSLAALVGAAGLAIGLALQGSLSNLASGIMLLLLRPFKVGDVIVVSGQTGKVDDVDLFNTKLDTPDNRRVIVPNSQVFCSTIENITHHAWRRCDLSVTTPYAADARAARQALRRAGESIAQRDPAKPVDVVMQSLGPNGVEWLVRVWVPTADFLVCRDRLAETVTDALEAASLRVAHPQLDLWVRAQPAIETGPRAR